MIDGKIEGLLPTSYEKKTTLKKKIIYNDLYLSDSRIFGNTIGLITNYSSTYYAMYKLDIDDDKKKIISKRLDILNSLQSQAIDFGKGLDVMSIPKFFGDWSKIKEDDTEEVKEKKKLNNQLIANQRPYFFRYVYSHQDKKYKNHIEKYNDWSISKWNISINQLLEIENKTDEQNKFCFYFNRYSPLFDSDSTMNNICRYMEKKVVELSEYKTDFSWKFNVDVKKLEELRVLYRDWKVNLNRIRRTEDFDEDSFSIQYRKKADGLQVKDTELAKMSLMINSHFAFSIFGNDICKLFKKKTVSIPISLKNGAITFNGETFDVKEFEV
jgi:hypothetical protein